ncbi:bifunctional riboflavin kinase/FAD synthetase [Aureimonas fodinaquatilis]|uniref:Riboflavin biosynthesis protein n=1 Tax=Aureimonas fodinaquatilis TaxID=2565783 RepID=A0A5B0E444_9HYPH|nr:bifunctional riboflavin kinase/FAD synthetase [Aureimonas fodinaquatilis]
MPAELKGCVVAIGNFDGVHRGHQAVLGRAKDEAARLGVPLVCLTFEPHPRTVFKPDQPVARLTAAPLKARILSVLGFDAVVEQAFTREFAAQSAESFIRNILLEQLAARHVVVGYDFQYGARRAGTPATLIQAGHELGFGVTVVDEFDDEGGAVVSSSRVRVDLAAGDIAGANSLLGYRWMVSGTVEHGRKLGRSLGYPTANMQLADDCLLAHGIYAVRFRRADGSLHGGVASFGRRPTFDDGAPVFETFLLDFSGDLYGEEAVISIFAYLRGELKFDNVDALIRQMDADTEVARQILARAEPLSEIDRHLAFVTNA